MAIDPKVALANIDKAVSQLQGTRDTHALLQDCVAILEKVIDEWVIFKNSKQEDNR